MKKKKILIVDDDPMMIKMRVEILDGYPTLTALNGKEAFEIICSLNSNIDLVISDLKMPS